MASFFFFFFSPSYLCCKKNKDNIIEVNVYFCYYYFACEQNLKLNNVDMTLKRLGDRFCNMLE